MIDVIMIAAAAVIVAVAVTPLVAKFAKWKGEMDAMRDEEKKRDK